MKSIKVILLCAMRRHSFSVFLTFTFCISVSRVLSLLFLCFLSLCDNDMRMSRVGAKWQLSGKFRVLVSTSYNVSLYSMINYIKSEFDFDDIQNGIN